MSFSLMSQNRFDKLTANRKSCCPCEIRNGSFLSRHRPDARVALQQSPILQGDMDKLREMGYNDNRKSSFATSMEDRLKPLRPFTQLLEHTLSYPCYLFKNEVSKFKN
jgi:hypothetical protein